MKRLVGYALFCLLSASALGAHAQRSLAGTAWQGNVRTPHPAPVVFQFGRDTLRVFDQASRAVIETVVFSTKAHRLTWRKVSGISPCDTQPPGTYAYRSDHDRLFLTLVADAYDARSGASDGGSRSKK